MREAERRPDSEQGRALRESRENKPREVSESPPPGDARGPREGLVSECELPEQPDLSTPTEDAGEQLEARLEELAALYQEDLQELSDFAPEVIDPSNWEPRSPEENAEARREYSKERASLIRGWEEKHGQEWPRYAQDVGGPPARRAGQLYDCHHIQPLEAGGANGVENVMPLHVAHHGPGATQGVHRLGAPLSRLVSALKEA
jgi:hypothetical protein